VLPATQSHTSTEGSDGILIEQPKHGLDLDLAEQPNAKKTKLHDRVKKTANFILEEIDWKEQLTYSKLMEEIGFQSLEDKENAFAILIGGTAIHRQSQELIDTRGSMETSEKWLLDALNSYMGSMNDSRLHAILLPFREIVFTSICVVLRHQGFSTQNVEHMLQIGLGLREYSPTLFARFCRAAQWVGKLATFLYDQHAWQGHFELLLMFCK
jgi:hypothetical protein